MGKGEEDKNMPKISGLDHVAIVTKDLKESLRFFETNLGLVCTHIEDLPERGIRVAMIPIGDTRIELIESQHEKSEVAAFLQKRGPGLHHIAFRSENVASDMQALTAQGVPFTTDTPRPGAHGCQVVFAHPKGTGGVLVELVSQP